MTHIYEIIPSSDILSFKFSMKHLWGRKNMNYTFFVTLALSGPRGQVQNGQKLRIFQKSSYFRTFEKKNEFIMMYTRKPSTKSVSFISPKVGVCHTVQMFIMFKKVFCVY